MRTANIAVLSCVLIVASGASETSAAIINVANGKPIIGGNSDYSAGDFNSGGTFGTFNVTDGQNALPDNNTGTLTEVHADGSYWLGRQSATTGYFVLDLQSPFKIGEFQIFNTSNGTPNDRGTGQFTIKASQTVTNLGGTLGFDLSGTVVTLASGTLTTHVSPGLIVGDMFISSDMGTDFRYIRFDVLSISSGRTQGFGLNELRIFAAPPVPEPSTLALLGLGAISLAIKVRRRRTAA